MRHRIIVHVIYPIYSTITWRKQHWTLTLYCTPRTHTNHPLRRETMFVYSIFSTHPQWSTALLYTLYVLYTITSQTQHCTLTLYCIYLKCILWPYTSTRHTEQPIFTHSRYVSIHLYILPAPNIFLHLPVALRLFLFTRCRKVLYCTYTFIFSLSRHISYTCPSFSNHLFALLRKLS